MIFKVIAIILLLLITFNPAVTMLLLFGWIGSDGKLIRHENDVQCLETVIPIIKKNYLDPEGKYYNGATVEGVSVYYNNSDFWRDTMNREIDRMFQEER